MTETTTILVHTFAGLALGALTWTLLEYCIHRWLGHDRRLMPNPFAAEHVRHHSSNYFAPTWKKLLAALCVFALVAPVAILTAGVVPGVAYALGLVGFYGVYEVLHRLEHVYEGFGPYGRWARRHHFYHHFTDPRMNHGVTSPLWDFVFRTYRTPGVIRVPEKLKLEWLVDEEGEVRQAYAASYELRRAKTKAA
jgi:4-hydroxysphinganine ceramide fatty acyl 2-hydroxylase